jgi:hypothetical protein
MCPPGEDSQQKALQWETEQALLRAYLQQTWQQALQPDPQFRAKKMVPGMSLGLQPIGYRECSYLETEAVD